MGWTINGMGARRVTYVVSREMMDRDFRQHAQVLELALSQLRAVAGDEDQLSLARPQRLQSRFVAESDCNAVSEMRHESARPGMDTVPLPDFITSANLELMLLASFLLFF